jgi:hypothetical protein
LDASRKTLVDQIARPALYLIEMKNKHSQQLGKAFLEFIEIHPPGAFSASLRRMLLDYLAAEITLGLPLDFGAFLHSLYDLFELLDQAQHEKAGG